MKRVLLLFVVGVIVVVLFGGCATSQSGPGYFLKTKSAATVFVDPAAPPIRKVALLPFKAPTELIGGSVSELFITELLKAGRYTLVERAQISKILSESELSMSGMTSAQAIEIGSMVGADGVIIGTVDQYETQANKGRTYPVIGITLRLIDCSTSKIGWSVDLASRAEDKNSSLAVHSRAVVHEMMAGLYRDLMKYLPPNDPTNVKTSDMELRKAVITWRRTSESDITYIIERADSKDGTYTEVGRTDMSSGFYTDSGLGYAKSYCYKITALSMNGVKSRPTAPVETFTSPLPAPVTTPKAQSDLVRSVVLTWQPPAEKRFITGYQAHRALAANGSYEKIADIRGINTTEYIDGGREPGKLDDASEYYYKIFAVNEANALSEKATVVSASTRNAPPAVKAFTAQSKCPREIPLSWEPSDDEKVVGYIISCLNEVTGDFAEVKRISGRAVDTWVDRGGEKKDDRIGKLQDGTSYKYQVAAYNIGNTQSAWSEVVSAMTKKSPAKPSIPECVNGLVGVVELEWKTNHEKDIENYVIACSETKDGRYKECGRTGECSFKHSDRDNGTEYFYKVKAIDTDTLESEWSESGSATTKPCPDAPSGLGFDGNSDGYLVKWTPPAQNDVTSYAVHKKSFIGKSSIGFSNKPEFVLTSEQVGKSIEIYVTAKDKDGLESGFSESCVVVPAQ